MQQRHTDRQRYFNEQVYTTEKYVIPFIEQACAVKAGLRVLEIGCGEAGNLQPFLDKGCICTGIELSEKKIAQANKFYEQHPQRKNLSLLTKNIYDYSECPQPFDIIFMRDVVEHIPNQEKLLNHIRIFAHAHTVLFVAFPPWQNPFGGHQQVCKGKIASHLPYYHLLPLPLYKGALRLLGETQPTINDLIDIKETGISIERFEKILKQSPFEVQKSFFYLINPNYEVKFGLKPRAANALKPLCYVRNFFTTCAYYLLEVKKQ
ncbi:MAG: class I SAM-dependent methyltransferase [Prevotellaceae bacterium]|jgi:SAM-dependent methyltransferase|nr:class I SAM-dependent methyltransferase [Prevotellaceae bacterium]